MEQAGTQPPLTEIIVATGNWPGSASLLIAQDQDFFPKHGLSVELNQILSGHLGLAAVLAGEAHLATVGETPIVRAILNDQPVTVIATISQIDRPIRIVARQDSGISAPQNLKGKRIGVVPTTTADFFLHIFLITSYIDPSQVELVELTTDTLIESLAAGEVDAVATWMPHTTRAIAKLGDNAVVLEDPGIYRGTWNIVAHQDWAKQHRNVIVNFLRAIVQANDFIENNPSQAKTIVAAHLNMDHVELEQSWPDFEFVSELGQCLLLYFEDQAKWLQECLDCRNHPPDFLDNIDSRGLRAVRPQSVRILKP